MKKSRKIAISSLCLTPLLLLSACVPPPSYTITASSSDSNLGYVQGFYKEEREEGSKVGITAHSFSENGFVCWVKDNKTIISNESELKLTYEDETAGHYTAIFEEDDISKMLYSSFTGISFKPAGYTKVEYEISTALLSSGSNDFYTFAGGEHLLSEEYNVEPTSVLYFGGAGDEYTYLIKINFKLFNDKNEETLYEYSLQTRIDKHTFNNKANLVIKETVEALDNTSLSLTFKKLTLKEYTESEIIDLENNTDEEETKDKLKFEKDFYKFYPPLEWKKFKYDWQFKYKIKNPQI